MHWVDQNLVYTRLKIMKLDANRSPCTDVTFEALKLLPPDVELCSK